jgi:hypothetical protein
MRACHIGPVLGRSRPARPDNLQHPGGLQRRSGVVTVQPELDQLVEDPRVLRSRPASMCSCQLLRDRLTLPHRELHRTGTPPEPPLEHLEAEILR